MILNRLLKVSLVLCLLMNSFGSFATSHTVTNLNDTGSGSLRDVLGLVATGDTILFSNAMLSSSSDTIKLNSPLILNRSLVILGPNMPNYKLYLSGQTSTNIAEVSFSRFSPPLEIQNLGFINGSTTQFGKGGAIAILACSGITLKKCEFKNNSANYGGAINSSLSQTSDKNVIIEECLFDNNSSTSGGGAIYLTSHDAYALTWNISKTTFSNNTAVGSRHGGAIYCRNGIDNTSLPTKDMTINITETTFANNTGYEGAAFYSYHDPDGTYSNTNITITKSTFTGNVNTYLGIHGAALTVTSSIYATAASLGYYLTMYGCSVVDNIGKGIYYGNRGGNGNITIGSSIWAFNTRGDFYVSRTSGGNGGSAISSSGYNLISDAGRSGALPTDQVGVTAANVNLGPLQNNGGVTETRMPGVGSIAINAGNPNDMSDAQNGSIEGGRRDIGAAEYVSCLVNSTTGTDVQTACNTYTWIDGNAYTSSNNTATHTLTNAAGCDSVVTLNLTINNSTTGTDVQTACDTYTWIDGNTYTSSNNTATYTLTNAAGCDSVVTLNLTINNSTTGIDVQTACNTYTWIDGNTYTSSNNTATHTLTNAVGCDSVVTLNLTINNSTTGTDVQTACDTYTWIDGNTYTSSNNTATHTLTNGAGCDSVVTLNLTINNSTTGTDVQTACDTYTWIDGNTYTSSNNTATHTLTNGAGCDSVVTLNLTINNSTTGTDVQTACDTYTWIDGNTYTSSNNTATHTLTNGAGCDSVVTLNLTINNSTTGTDVQMACDTYTWIDGNTYTSSNNTATHILTNAVGCDSVVTLNLTINNSTTGTDVQTACNTYTWIDGNTYTSSNNTATHTLTNAAGCDSVVTLNLTINNSTTGTDVQTACDTYTWIDGNTYTSSNNTATHTLTNAVGCDSVVTLDLTITTIDTMVTQSGIVLTANQSGATYQWVDCNNGNAAIVGETMQSFTPSVDGDYAVMITFNNCTSTSSCFNVVVNAVSTIEEGTMQARVYPNPTTGQVNIELEEVLEQGFVRLMDVNGRVLVEKTVDGEQFIQLNVDALPTAVYFLELRSSKGIYTHKIIKE